MTLLTCLASILLSRPYVVWVYGMYAVEVGLSLVLAVRVAGSMARRLLRSGVPCPVAVVQCCGARSTRHRGRAVGRRLLLLDVSSVRVNH